MQGTWGQSPVRELRPPPAARQPSPRATAAEARGHSPCLQQEKPVPCSCGLTPAPRSRKSSHTAPKTQHGRKTRKKRRNNHLGKRADFIKLNMCLPAIEPFPGSCPRDTKHVSADTGTQTFTDAVFLNKPKLGTRRGHLRSVA